MRAASRWFEAGLDGSALLLPALLALVPHGAAPLAGFAGLCAAGLVWTNPPDRLAMLRYPAALLAGIVLWGGLSAAWAIDPSRTLILDVRLVGLFAAALALAAAADRLAVPQRFVLCLCAGTAVGSALALVDLASAGGLSQYVSVRGFRSARLNQIAAWLAMLWLPIAALLVCRGRHPLALASAAAMAGAVLALDGTTAKTALALSLPMAGLLYLRRGTVARIMAAVAVVAIVTAPATLPRLHQLPGVFASVDAVKDSAGHRLLIWSFVGDRIAERPLAGWGLDSARAIPGGKTEIRPGMTWLPLHTHNAALQLWLELGVPGAALFALLVTMLWLRLAAAPWPRLYAAAAGGSLAATLFVAFAGWGIWQEWWLGTLSLALFATLVMASVAPVPKPAPIPAPTPPPMRRRRGWRACGR